MSLLVCLGIMVGKLIGKGMIEQQLLDYAKKHPSPEIFHFSQSVFPEKQALYLDPFGEKESLNKPKFSDSLRDWNGFL